MSSGATLGARCWAWSVIRGRLRMRRIFPRKGITAVHDHSQQRSGARRSDVSLSRGTKLLPRVGGRSSQSPFHGREGSNVQREVVPEDLWRLLLTYISIIFRGGRLTPRTVWEWRNYTDEPWQGVIRNMSKERPNKREDHPSNWRNRWFLSCPREHHFSFGEASLVLVFDM